MKRPFLIALAAGVISLLIAFVPVLQRMLAGPPPPGATAPATTGAPWQVGLPAPGRSQVFALKLPGTTLAETRQRFGDDLRVALMAGRDGRLSLEGYVERFESGGVGGKLLLAFDGTGQAGALARWRDALPGTPIESGGRQHSLNAAAADELNGTGLVGLSFIPAAKLDAATLTARFGAPAERIAGEQVEHWLYPAQGLAVALATKGRDVLQYVAPAEFEARLVAPLR